MWQGWRGNYLSNRSLKRSGVETKILIVDNALDSWTLLSSIVRPHHVHPIWSADGIQALSEARQHRPHVFLSNLGLPGGGRLCRTQTTEE